VGGNAGRPACRQGRDSIQIRKRILLEKNSFPQAPSLFALLRLRIERFRFSLIKGKLKQKILQIEYWKKLKKMIFLARAFRIKKTPAKGVFL